MSMSIKVARASARGDPGILDFAKKVGRGVVGAAKTVGGVVIDIAPGPIGIAARKARSFVRGRGVATSDIGIRGAPSLQGRVRPGVGVSLRGGRGVAQRFAQDVERVQAERRALDLRAGDFEIRMLEEGLGGEPETFTSGVTSARIGCPPGMRPNKSSYFRRSPAGGVVFIDKGTVCVKSRRRNPLNPRALDRAVGRVASFANADSRSRKKIKAAARKIG